MARGKSTAGNKWNFHATRYYCPFCKRKGLTRSNNNGKFYCMYSKLGCGAILENWGKDREAINALNDQLIGY